MRRPYGTAFVRFLRRIVTTRLTSRYRPELHYMRGPGPKSRGRHREIAVTGERMASPGHGGKSPGP